MAKKGFTIVEVLMSLAIVVAMMLIVWPNLGGMRTRASLESASSQVQAAAAECRSSAIQQGRALRLVMRSMVPGLAGQAGLFIEPIANTEPAGPRSQKHDEAASDSIEPRGARLVAQLGSGVTVMGAEPEASRSSPSVAGGPTPEEPAGVALGDRADGVELLPAVTVATYLPDGSAIADGPRYLRGPDAMEATLRIDVNRWSGRVDISPLRRGRVAVDDTEGAREPSPDNNR